VNVRPEQAAAAGSVVGAVLASACCIGPLVFAVLGISGAAFAQSFEPFRPYLLVATYALLGGAFYFTYRPGPTACAPGSACEMPRTNRFGRAMLWMAAVIVVLATAFPWYAEYLPL
jgi:mercuric ion transport protein